MTTVACPTWRPTMMNREAKMSYHDLRTRSRTRPRDQVTGPGHGTRSRDQVTGPGHGTRSRDHATAPGHGSRPREQTCSLGGSLGSDPGGESRQRGHVSTAAVTNFDYGLFWGVATICGNLSAQTWRGNCFFGGILKSPPPPKGDPLFFSQARAARRTF
jgi:hypothetical protein